MDGKELLLQGGQFIASPIAELEGTLAHPGLVPTIVAAFGVN